MNNAVHESEILTSVIRSPDQFASIADKWRELHTEAGACVFMTWNWHYTWWQVYGSSSDELYLVQFTQNDVLVGLLPMYLKREGIFSSGTLMFLGTGEAREDEVATEYLDVLASPGVANQVADAALNWLSNCQAWKKVELRCMLEDALLVQAYRQRNDLHLLEHKCGFRYRVNLADTEAEHLAKLSSSKVKRLQRSQRALERDGGLEQVSVKSEKDLDAAFKQLTELNHERQEQKQRKSVFASDRFRSFHRKLIDRKIHLDGVNIHQFKLNANLLSIVYCFYDEETCYYYQSGFVRRYSNKYMPLTFAHLAEIQRNRETGRKYYDLMRAEPPSYKEDFGCETTPMVNVFLFGKASHLGFFNLHRSARRRLVSLLANIGIARR